MRTITSEEYIYDTETGTHTQTRIIPLYTFDELSEDAQNRVVADYMIERENDPYFGQWFIDAYEREIWECVRDLENNITGARVNWHYNRWYSCDFDCEYSYDDCYDPCELEPIENNGYYASMDICDAWNAHIKKLNALVYLLEYIDHLCDDVYYYECWYMGAGPENKAFYNRLDNMRDNLISKWFEELEKACDDVRNAIETLLRGEWEYYTSEEYARMECEDETTQGYKCRQIDKTGRVYYSDCRKWYTVDGELYEQSNVNHACISIVKSSHYE